MVHIFLDESRYNDGRYRSVAAVSVRAEVVAEVREKLRLAIALSKKIEFKYVNLTSADARISALTIVDALLPFIQAGSVRVDVLVWDTMDKRHIVAGANKHAAENLNAMVRFLVVNIMAKRWVRDREWSFQSDKQSQVVYSRTGDTIEQLVAAKRGSAPGDEPVLNVLPDEDSKNEPLIQVADLFAGLAAYVRENSKALHGIVGLPDLALREMCKEKRKPLDSQSNQQRFAVVRGFLEKAATAKFGVILDPTEGFKSGIKSPLNFWNYKPQGSHDKAPGTNSRVSDEIRTYSCSVAGCDIEFELEYLTARPLCREHYRISIEHSDERSERKAARNAHAQGSHYCAACFELHTPTELERLRANAIGRPPHCPHCGIGDLVRLGGDDGNTNSTDAFVEGFEDKRSRYDRR